MFGLKILYQKMVCDWFMQENLLSCYHGNLRTFSLITAESNLFFFTLETFCTVWHPAAVSSAKFVKVLCVASQPGQ